MVLRTCNKKIVAVDNPGDEGRPQRGALQERSELIRGQTDRKEIGSAEIPGCRHTHGYDRAFDQRTDEYIRDYGLSGLERLSADCNDLRVVVLRQRCAPRHR